MMFIVSFILGGEPYWINIIGFGTGGFIYGVFIHPMMERKMKYCRTLKSVKTRMIK